MKGTAQFSLFVTFQQLHVYNAYGSVCSPLHYVIGSDYYGNPRPYNKVSDIGSQEYIPPPAVTTDTTETSTTGTTGTTGMPATGIPSTPTGTDDESKTSEAHSPVVLHSLSLLFAFMLMVVCC